MIYDNSIIENISIEINNKSNTVIKNLIQKYNETFYNDGDITNFEKFRNLWIFLIFLILTTT